jgi:hypothetical protein
MAHKCLTSPQTSFPQQNTNQTALFLTRILRTAYIKTILCTRTSKSTDSSIPAFKRPLSNPSSSCKIDFKLPLVSTTALLLSQDFFCLLIRVASASAGYWRSGKKTQQQAEQLPLKKQHFRESPETNQLPSPQLATPTSRIPAVACLASRSTISIPVPRSCPQNHKLATFLQSVFPAGLIS